MPCRDNYSDDRYFESFEIARLREQISFAESALCGALSALESITSGKLDLIDYKARGITQDALQAWWENHKRLDAEIAKSKAEAAARKKQAAQEKRLKTIERNKVLALLTKEQREVLGV